tara:strand:- start:141298 stop:142425 length:1128 start_codon:yes stop_codon:yes gene_type:complete
LFSDQDTTEAMNQVLQRYQDNFPRHLLAVNRQLDAGIMERLVEQRGHRGLRLSFEPYISLAAGGATRISQIADSLGVTRQAANAVANELQSLGYIQRVSDPEDGRAKHLVLTPFGEQLRADGLKVAAALQTEYRRTLGDAEFTHCLDGLESLVARLPDTSPEIWLSIENTPVDARFAALLPRLGDYVSRQLMLLTINRGHPGLKLSYQQVLTLIGRDGGRMQTMAQVHKVSKQAINAIATELQQLGYIERRPDPRDARQLLLHFTPAGLDLLRDSVNAIRELEAELAGMIGDEALHALKGCLRALYNALQPEPRLNAGDLDDMARNLLSRLGPARARELAELLTALASSAPGEQGNAHPETAGRTMHRSEEWITS